MRKQIQEGEYAFWIAKADVRRGMLDVTFQIARNRTFLGRKIKRSFALAGKNVWQLRQMLEACGWTIRDEVMNLELNELIGEECAGSVVDDCGSTVIWQFFPITKLEQQEVESRPENLATAEMPRYVM